jgi:hypothetical protein
MVIWDLQNFIQRLDSIGLVDIMLPFLLIFTLFFAVLEKSKIFGPEGEKRNINIVVSLIIGLIVVIPHATGSYPSDYDVVNIMNLALPAIALVVVAVVMLLLLIGVWGGQAKWTQGSLATWIFFVSLIIVVWAFGAAAGRFPGWDWLRGVFGEDAISIVIILLVFALIIAFITGGSRGELKGNQLSKIGQSIGEFFGSGGKG